MIQINSLLSCTSQVTVDFHQSGPVSADRHISADRPEHCHVSADHLEVRNVSPVHPKSGHLLSTAPRSVFRFPSLMSSVRDAPLVSARAAGIPKPIYVPSCS